MGPRSEKPIKLADRLIREICGRITTGPFKAKLHCDGVNAEETHVHDEKVQPAPGIGEVGLEAIGDPFQEHLDDKDEGENFVSKLQDDFHGSSPFDVYVFKGLPEDKEARLTSFLKDSPR